MDIKLSKENLELIMYRYMVMADVSIYTKCGKKYSFKDIEKLIDYSFRRNANKLLMQLDDEIRHRGTTIAASSLGDY